MFSATTLRCTHLGACRQGITGSSFVVGRHDSVVSELCVLMSGERLDFRLAHSILSQLIRYRGYVGLHSKPIVTIDRVESAAYLAGKLISSLPTTSDD